MQDQRNLSVGQIREHNTVDFSKGSQQIKKSDGQEKGNDDDL